MRQIGTLIDAFVTFLINNRIRMYTKTHTMGKVKNWTVEKKDEIESILIGMWAGLGMDIPDNYEDIVQDCYEDVCETADPIHWSNADVAIAFRRWIEAQAKDEVHIAVPFKISKECPHFEPAMEDKFTEINSPEPRTPMYGDQISTVEQLKHILSHLDDHDLLCIETIDLQSGDVEDLFPMYVDVIDNIKLTDDTIVREVRFCQMMNSAPDTRDKQPLVDAVIEDQKRSIALGDLTVLDELLKFIPWEILKSSLPEEQWERFNNLK